MTDTGISGIDHVLIAVHDLEVARMHWTRLGFALSPRGKHLGRGSGNYCIMFERDYLELFGVIGPEAAAPEYVAFLAEREGGMKLALATADARASAAALTTLGLHPAPPRDLARQLELPEGTAVPRFDIVALPGEETPGVTSFLCAHLTPELMRRPAWLTHANATTGIACVTIVVDDTAPLAACYERIVGHDNFLAEGGIVTARLGAHRVRFAAAREVAAMYPEIAIDSGAQGPIAAVTLTVRDLNRTLDHLVSWHVEHEQTSDGRILVPPHEANGIALEFTAEPIAERR